MIAGSVLLGMFAGALAENLVLFLIISFHFVEIGMMELDGVFAEVLFNENYIANVSSLISFCV